MAIILCNMYSYRYIEGSLFFLSQALILWDHLEAGIAKCTAVAA